MQKISPVDIQHKTFKRKLQGYDPADVDQFLDEVIEVLEDDAHKHAALEAEIADLKERISHFKAMEESLQNTLVLAQRTADEVKASAHKEADLIRLQARVAADKEVVHYNDAIAEARREHQRTLEESEKAKSEIRSLLMTHMALLERTPQGGPYDTSRPQQQTLIATPDTLPLEVSQDASPPPDGDAERITVY
ncbi:MAG TPA: DivIVA domain-containing protein [Verrucomicrobiae bacterium]|jgi:cell division initiation protein|nr:DivIVA domain-containing protein [Verrucomicrobiae bacterium]